MLVDETLVNAEEISEGVNQAVVDSATNDVPMGTDVPTGMSTGAKVVTGVGIGLATLGLIYLAKKGTKKLRSWWSNRKSNKAEKSENSENSEAQTNA